MSVDISPDEVRRHARDVDEVGRMLDEVRAAGARIRTSTGAYGYLIGPLFTTRYLNPHGDEAVDAMRKAVDGMLALADELRAIATAFERTDQEAAAELRGRGE
ncbi:type VII secretion target [Actinoplanes oblitus]|uniref:Type VII secretion target n=1 Tax=Actinoplanes oblitus TaxID=3040509 RepID=A0ABY8WHT8_9ACTN|nr:type VII secretion target [Actinoplanes oblitus]WIM96977.1 type VII secretion target [Actinoplanes oblitus]